jgi:L-ascorbate metabolism protein UlaG (beta-lactamase superfamily)
MKQILTVMAALFCAQVGAKTPACPTDVIETAQGKDLKITFFGHGSIAFEYEGKYIYIDPVSDFADYSALPKADLILVGHEHGDHLDPKAIKALSTTSTFIIGNGTAIEALGRGTVLEHGQPAQIKMASLVTGEGPTICELVEAVPAYNTSPEKQNFHPRARLHNGYILVFGGTRVYVAGDSEDTPEMMALEDIDIAFLPVNLPYTMTEEQAARAARAIAPEIFYPYHYGGTQHKTDLTRLAALLSGSGIEMRVRPLE